MPNVSSPLHNAIAATFQYNQAQAKQSLTTSNTNGIAQQFWSVTGPGGTVTSGQVDYSNGTEYAVGSGATFANGDSLGFTGYVDAEGNITSGDISLTLANGQSYTKNFSVSGG